MDSIETSGKSIEEAVAQALASLGRRRDEVEVMTLQEPSRGGTFGFGSKEARVRVTVRHPANPAIITPEMADALLGPEILSDEEEVSNEEEEIDEEPVSFIPALELAKQALLTKTVEHEPQEGKRSSHEDAKIAIDVLQHILRFLDIDGTIHVRSHHPLTLNIEGIGENLALLIGRRGETLSAFQLIVNMIVSHRIKHRLRIVIDAEDYRLHREENLRSMALRIAQQVRASRRPIALEAMTPYERRLVHIALADDDDISTASTGEGEERRVVISLKIPH